MRVDTVGLLLIQQHLEEMSKVSANVNAGSSAQPGALQAPFEIEICGYLQAYQSLIGAQAEGGFPAAI